MLANSRRLLRGVLACALLGIGQASVAEYQLLDRVVAIAEDDVVLASEVRGEMFRIKRTLEARGNALPPDSVLYEQVLERSILDSLQLQRAYKIGLRISDQELNDAMQRVAAQNRLTLPQFREALEKSGQSYLDAREQMRKEMLIRRVQQRGVMRGMNISESEVQNFLQSARGQGAARTRIPDRSYFIAAADHCQRSRAPARSQRAEKHCPTCRQQELCRTRCRTRRRRRTPCAAGLAPRRRYPLDVHRHYCQHCKAVM